MSRKVRSIKGDVVDFDLFEVKKQIGEKPVSTDVENRERFVFSKRRRGSKRAVESLLKDQKVKEAKVRHAMKSAEFAKQKRAEQAGSATPEETKEVKSKSPEPTPRRRIVKKKK